MSAETLSEAPEGHENQAAMISWAYSFWTAESGLLPRERLVLVALALEADVNGVYTGGGVGLLPGSGMSLSTICRAMRRLSDLGLIARKRRFGAPQTVTLNWSTKP